ncbi:endonuclease/exonuclease/phosphatase family protein [Costertonia aggregata]|uniref:Endonuclease n=1 Tax=Costertonia aggregata TaxID=343403 RepID=A0A7H9AQ37_9FLAO|nr:endonuclease [Costertonia aggregata]QLG45365.1 endonuclease [Costertonia aggregata]
MLFPLFRRKKKDDLHTIAFYNLENLFDTKDNPNTLDDDFTPEGFKRWSTKRYKRKLYKLAKTISEIGIESSRTTPVLIGVAEVENRKVVQDLVSAEPLKEIDYGIVHYDSPDERGIDTALVYLKSNFEVLASEPITLFVDNPNGERDTTRDILYVYGRLNGEETHIFVNHWPSRRDGEDATDYKRIEAAKTLIRKMTRIEKTQTEPNYIIMGDFNDGPTSPSIQELMKTGSLYNPMEKLLTPDKGSANYKGKWMLFDQILISHNFLNYEKHTHSFARSDIFSKASLTEFKGKYKGTPYRTYAGRKYIGGYSDHFPVYIQLKYNS